MPRGKGYMSNKMKAIENLFYEKRRDHVKSEEGYILPVKSNA